MGHNYIVRGTHTVEEVFEAIGKGKVKFGKASVKNSRIQNFYHNGTKCVSCGLEGTLFKIERPAKPGQKGKRKNRYLGWHLNLYGQHHPPNGGYSLLTQDHIVPRSKGGTSELHNLQPMCSSCNNKKGDKLPWDINVDFLAKRGRAHRKKKVRVLDWSRLLSIMWWLRAIKFALKAKALPGKPTKWVWKKIKDRKMELEDKQKQQWGEAMRLVSEFFKDSSKAVKWMGTKNPLLGDQIPIEMIAIGRGEKLLKFIKVQLEENEAP